MIGSLKSSNLAAVRRDGRNRSGSDERQQGCSSLIRTCGNDIAKDVIWQVLQSFNCLLPTVVGAPSQRPTTADFSAAHHRRRRTVGDSFSELTRTVPLLHMAIQSHDVMDTLGFSGSSLEFSARAGRPVRRQGDCA